MGGGGAHADDAQGLLCATPSLLNAPIGDIGDLEAGRVALAGVFCDHFSGGRPGARFAPRQLRYASRSLPATKKLCAARREHAVIDIGDLKVFPLQPARNAQALCEQSESIASTGAKLFAIGGDYSVTPHFIDGLLRAHRGATIGMLRVSRCLDLQTGAGTLTRPGASAAVRELLGGSQKSVPPTVLFVGTAPAITQEEAASVACADIIGMHALTSTRDCGLAAALQRLKTRCDGCYLSVDADVLSPLYGETSFARSGAGLSPCGLVDVLDQLEQIPLLGADVMGHVPDLDLAGITTTSIVLSIVSRIAELLVETRGVA